MELAHDQFLGLKRDDYVFIRIRCDRVGALLWLCYGDKHHMMFTDSSVTV